LLLIAILPAVAAGGEPAAAEIGPLTRPGGPASQPAEAIKLSPAEQVLLADVRDDNDQLDQAAFYDLLEKARNIAEMHIAQQVPLDRPAGANLLASPARYRGWPMIVPFRVVRVQTLAGPGELSVPPGWPADRKIWQLAGYVPNGTGKKDLPVLVFTTVKPKALGKPLSVDAAGEEHYPLSKKYEVAGFFLKVYRTKDRTGRVTDLPVLIAWSIEPVASPARQSPRKGNWLVVAIVAMLVGYMLIKRMTIRRSRQDRDEFQYGSLSREPDSPAAGPSDSSDADNRTEVNPALVDAIRRRETHGRQPEQERPGSMPEAGMNGTAGGKSEEGSE